MPDITMCTGNNCKYKDNCYRHTANPCEFRQSYFVVAPICTESQICHYFWDNKEYNAFKFPNVPALPSNRSTIFDDSGMQSCQ